MGKTLAYRLFHAGRFPSQLRAQMESEGILVQDEGIPGSVTYRNFHRPGAYSSWRRQWYTTSLAVTQTRLVGLAYSSPIINVPFSDERFQRLNISLEKSDALLIAFDASLFHSDWSGKIEYRFRTPQAQAFLDALKARAH
jgi:hypothetical protein